MSDPLYTMGVWVAKPGKEEQFVDAWREMAAWTASSFEGTTTALLLRDQNDGRRFVSFGPWRSEEDVAAWRASEGFRDRVQGLQPLLERFEPGSFTAVCRIGE
jgi:heme-degrading monooxygenase HmoA